MASKKLCNAYRASDRISQYLIRHVIDGDREHSPDDVFLRIVLFRLFSKQSTWELLEQENGGVCRAALDVDRLGDVLARRRESAPIYTAAFILAPPAYGHAAKHRNNLALVDAMFKPGKLAKDLAQAASLREVFALLAGLARIGGGDGQRWVRERTRAHERICRFSRLSGSRAAALGGFRGSGARNPPAFQEASGSCPGDASGVGDGESAGWWPGPLEVGGSVSSFSVEVFGGGCTRTGGGVQLAGLARCAAGRLPVLVGSRCP